MNIITTDYKDKYVNDLAEMHIEAFKDHFNSKLGKIYAKAFLRWFAKGDNDKIFVCAVDQDTDSVLGYMCGAPVGYAGKMNRELINPILISLLLRPWILFDHRALPMIPQKLKLIFSSKKKSSEQKYKNIEYPIMSATSLAVSSKARRMGIAEALYEEFFTRSAQKNMKTIRATILAENKPIYSYYTKHNWIPYEYMPNDELIYFFKKVK